MFTQTAAFYDKLYAAQGRSDERDAARVASVVREAVPGATTLLAVGCGVGATLGALERCGFTCAGVEADLKLAAIARSRLPEMRIEPADTTTFALDERFDAVVSLAGSSATVRTPARLAALLERMTAHLVAGGTIVVEPFLSFGQYRPGTLDAVFVDEPELKIARMSLSKQTGKIGILDYHYLIASLQGVERHFERHEVGLFTERTYRDAFEDLGFTMDVVAAREDEGELYVARASAPTSTPA